MRVYIRDERQTVSVRLYGLDGEECTRQFFDTFFHDVKEAHETTDEEREISGTDAEYTIDEGRLFAAFAEIVGNIQDSIDHVAIAMIDEEPIGEYTFDDVCYEI